MEISPGRIAKTLLGDGQFYHEQQIWFIEITKGVLNYLGAQAYFNKFAVRSLESNFDYAAIML